MDPCRILATSLDLPELGHRITMASSSIMLWGQPWSGGRFCKSALASISLCAYKHNCNLVRPPWLGLTGVNLDLLRFV